MTILSRGISLLGLLALCLAGPTAVRAQTTLDSTLYTVVDQMPQFGKSSDDVLHYLALHVRYPASTLQARIEGKVFVGFTVGITGQLENIRVIKGIHPDLNAEALRVVTTMPPWKPGRQLGKPVPVAYTLPITFRITRGNSETPARFAGTPEELYALLTQPPYPAEARSTAATGRVAVVFDITATGQVANVKALEALSAAEQRKQHQKPQQSVLHPALVAAAQQQIATMPAWKPALVNDKPVSSRMLLSVAYQLPAATDTVYALVDQMPQFPGGVSQLMQRVASTTRYPKDAWREKAEGEVLLYFVVNKQGQVEQAEVVRSVHPALDAEALRTIKALPAFLPALHHGRPAKVGFLLPLPFARN